MLGPEDNGIAHLSGTVIPFDDDQTALAESITLYYYVYNDLNDPVTDFVRGEGEIDPSTGIFSAMVDVPNGKSKVVLTFVVLDEADRTTNLYPDTVVVHDVLNDCGESYFTITLEEWDNEEEYLYLIVYEPNGSGGSPGGFQVRFHTESSRCKRSPYNTNAVLMLSASSVSCNIHVRLILH